jgi:hypothetical protein
MRRRHRSRHHLDGIALRRLHERDVRVVAICGREEWETLHMIPVQVGAQDRADERRARRHEHLAEGLKPRARVEYERR